MSQRSAVVPEKPVPQLSLPLAVVDQRLAGQDNPFEPFIPSQQLITAIKW